ncbi:hypothetical protein J7K70_01455 [bacterium]|nr:hypothetical protein [bacterium]
MDWSQFTTQFGQFLYQALTDLDKLVNKVFTYGILGHLWAILKASIRILIAVLEFIIKILKLCVK